MVKVDDGGRSPRPESSLESPEMDRCHRSNPFVSHFDTTPTEIKQMDEKELADPHPAVHLDHPGEDHPHHNQDGTMVDVEGLVPPSQGGIHVEEDTSEEDLKKDEEEEEDPNSFHAKVTHMKSLIWQALKYGLMVLLVVYLLAAFIIDFERARAIFVITVLVICYAIYEFWATRNADLVEGWEDKTLKFFEKCDKDLKYGAGLASLLILIMVIIIASTVRDGRNLISLFGLVMFCVLTWALSWKPTQVKWRPVLGGIFIQFIFGYVVIQTQWGFDAIDFAGDVFVTLLNYTYAGSQFVFSWLTDGSLFGRNFQLADGDVYNLGPPFFFNVLPTVIFFSALVSVGYYIRAIPWAVRKVGT